MWCGRELSDKGLITRLYGKVRAFAAPLFRKEKTARAPHLEQCFEAWLAEVQRADEAQDGGAYLARPVLEAIAEGRMPPSDGQEKLHDGWTEHDGGLCPFCFPTRVDVRQRDGRCFQAPDATKLRWTNTGTATDIVAYRKVSE